jgi:PAS domain S-box-containing protein
LQLIIQETDARQTAEEGKLRLETILQQLPVGVVLVNTGGKSIESNRFLEKITGRSIKEGLQKYENSSPSAFKDNKPISIKDWPVFKALENGETISGHEIEYRKDNKKSYFLRINAAPIRNKKKDIVAAVSTIDDITAEKELEQRKDDFVNMASHELKTPITSMKIYIEVLFNQIRSLNDDKIIKTVSSIKTQTESVDIDEDDEIR